MDARAAVAHETGTPTTIETAQLAGPKAGEVRIQNAWPARTGPDA
jgi:Zn-dependent alcohol dehydrogenase